MQNAKIYVAFILFLVVAACESKPKVIEGEPVGNSGNLSFDNAPTTTLQNEVTDIHKVVVREALNTERYTYLNVTEKEAAFWVAIPRQEVEIGATYYYKGGLLKKNFQSQEFNRIFETVYLVSAIRKQPINSNGSAIDEALSVTQGAGSLFEDAPVTASLAEGSLKLSELMANPGKYDGKLIKVTGKCIKVNPMIMGRNWVHIQDGSLESTDLTVTTTENIPLGALVSLEGTIALNKDFGAGYRYAVIMEDAVLK